jgi:hypothetical protein
MEKFFCDDNFYNDFEDFVEYLEIDEESVNDLDDDIKYDCVGSKKEPVFVFDIDWILDRIDDGRLTEEGKELSKIKTLIEGNCNFKKINESMPTLYYEDMRNKFTITKKDLIDYFKL